MRVLKVFVMTVVLLALVLAMENYTDWDVAVQNKLYFSDTGSWLITPEMHRQWDFVFYNGMKHFVAFWGTVSVLVMVAGFRIKSLRPKFAVMYDNHSDFCQFAEKEDQCLLSRPVGNL